jgi:hypothetical protein
VVDNDNIEANAVNDISVIRDFGSYPNSSNPAVFYTTNFSLDEAGEILFTWAGQGDGFRNYILAAYLNGNPADYVYALNPNYDPYDPTSPYAGFGPNYTRYPNIIYLIAINRAGNAFQDNPVMMGAGPGLSGTNTLRLVFIQNPDGGQIRPYDGVIPSMIMTIQGVLR